MQYYERPQINVLKGEEAVEVLNDYINELRENKPDELTKNQTTTMIKLAEGLIQAIESDQSTEGSRLKIPQVLSTLSSAITTNIAKILKEPSPPSPSHQISSQNHHLPPPPNEHIR
ncbi:MAG: hypothetical protein JSV51_09100 [Candidatus Bathyarchaeota archaeon]|nr:MAG: hypothetical protein JSV51_09100 [Candidatus Bathyarchaeota archaeon]